MYSSSLNSKPPSFLRYDSSGFSRTGAVFAGWCNKPVYDPNDGEAILFLPGVQTDETYHVDSGEPYTLYAVWHVSVVFHLNNDEANATFGGDWGTDYTLNAGEKTYTRNAVIGAAISKPPYDPADTQMFRNWRTAAHANGTATDDSDIYDFSKPITENIELYAYWDNAMTVGVRAADASGNISEWGSLTGYAEPVSADSDWSRDYATWAVSAGMAASRAAASRRVSLFIS